MSNRISSPMSPTQSIKYRVVSFHGTSTDACRSTHVFTGTRAMDAVEAYVGILSYSQECIGYDVEEYIPGIGWCLCIDASYADEVEYPDFNGRLHPDHNLVWDAR